MQGRRETSEAPGQKRDMRLLASKVRRTFSGSRNFLWKSNAGLLYKAPPDFEVILLLKSSAHGKPASAERLPSL